jgi:hypothetical protein
LIEVITGLSLASMPSATVSVLLGASLSEPAGLLLGRIGGVALISLALACWLAKNERHSSVVMIRAMILYNTGAAVLLVYAALILKFSGIGLWPAALLHAGLLAWCLQPLSKKPAGKKSGQL